ncbi:MAG: MFS transporter [Verrucomicrobia bacterium]|nr:MFS transporter [Verrucomicrobiota bacterium]
MSRRKQIGFLLTALNQVGCAYFGNYIFFLLRQQYGFGNTENLLVGALHGLVYVPAAIWGGRFAERRGLTAAMRTGFLGMALTMMVGALWPSVIGTLATLVAWTVAMCLTWPALEAHAMLGENGRGMQRMVGFYNVTWAGGSALMYFVGGAIFERLGPRSLFWIPAGLYVLQLAVTWWLESLPVDAPVAELNNAAEPHHPEAAAYQQPVPPKIFLQMAWLANPFAYIAINTVLAVIPQLAANLKLTAAQTGMFCSLWFFARLAAFVLLWQWSGWHYRFRWLLAAFIGLIAGFATLLLAGQFWLLLVAQLVFGLSAGLIYYSSLFYSMDVGETKSEHGGLHEAAIGAGICVGPAVGAAALHFAPGHPNAGTFAVAALLAAGLVGLIVLRVKARVRR